MWHKLFTILWLTVDWVLIVLIMIGGYHMIRAYLRRMRREEGLEEPKK